MQEKTEKILEKIHKIGYLYQGPEERAETALRYMLAAHSEMNFSLKENENSLLSLKVNLHTNGWSYDLLCAFHLNCVQQIQAHQVALECLGLASSCLSEALKKEFDQLKI